MLSMIGSMFCIMGLLAATEAPAKDILVGVSYFPGWWEPAPNKWHGADGKDWREKFPERMPLLGEFNTQQTMNREIRAAAEHGVDFFSILWYYNPPGIEREPNSRCLDRGVSDFMQSPENKRMRFMIEFCNHPPYEVATDEDWLRCMEFWKTCFANPRYLKVADKLVFKIHGGHFFCKQNGFDINRCKQRLDQLRQEVREAGLGEMLIGCGVGGSENIPKGHWAAELFDFTGTYMDVPDLPRLENDYPYTQLGDFLAQGRIKHFDDAIPYFPMAAAGWCPRPWPDTRACFAFPTRNEWTATLQKVKDDLKAQARLGLPGQKAFTIYAWNEFGEGGIVAPNAGDKYMKLEAIHRVFSDRQ